MSNDGGRSNETDALIDNPNQRGVYQAALQDGNSGNAKSKTSRLHQSMPDGMSNIPLGFDGGGLPTKSYSISGGQVSYLTPLQMGRHELYEILPYAAVFGLQRKERNLSRAFASYAADLDMMEAEQAAAASQTNLSEAEKITRRSKSEILMLDELEMEKVMVTTPLIFAVMVASMAQFLVGYNTGVMNAPESVVFVGHSITVWSIAVAAFAVGGPFGAVVAGKLADSRGRRGALLICIWTFFLGGVIQTAALDMFSIAVARFIIGFASGYSSVLVPIYLGELAPPTLRGTLGTMTQFALVIGILFSNLLAFVFATVTLWRVLFAVTPIIAVGQLICAPFLLETPRWLLNNDPESKRARVIIKRIRGLRYDYEVETEANHYISACRAQTCESEENSGAFMQMFLDKKVQWLVISALILQMAQQLCGINAVFYYSNMFFEGVIADPLVGTTIIGAVNVAATYVALLLMDSCGRRTLILWSSGGMFIACVLIVLSLLGYFANTVALAFVNVYVIFFEIGLGPIPWLIVAEMFDAKYVATAMSASSQLNWACNFIIGLVFPSMNKALGPYSFGPFAAVLLFTFVFALFYLPETQGTNPQELQVELQRKNSGTAYHNINIETSHATPIDMEWRLAMEQLKKEEEQAMQDGNYNYGFERIDNTVGVPDKGNETSSSEWKATLGGA